MQDANVQVEVVTQEKVVDGKVVAATKKVKPKAKPKAKAKAKPAPKKAAKPKAAKKEKLPKTVKPITPGRDGDRTWGPGTKMFKFKPVSVKGECDVQGCKSKAPNSFRCLKHKKEIRKVQLRENNKTWHKRIEKGTAKHHVVYTSPVTGKQELTNWALLNPDRALAQVKKGVSIVDADQFKKLLAKSKEAAAKNKRGAKGRAK